MEKAELCYLDETGDTKLIWDPNSEDEVENARQMFTRLKGKNYVAYSVEKKGDKGKVLTEFDPRAAKIIMAPMVAGG